MAHPVYQEHFSALHVPYAPGDRLWVREEYYQQGHWWEDASDLTKLGKPKWKFAPYSHEIAFDPPKRFLKARARKSPEDVHWYKRLGRFMSRRYSRLTLTVTDVRVQRLQDISEADAIAEGIYVAQWRSVIDCLEDPARANDFPPDTPVYMAPDDDSERFVKMKAVDAFDALWNSINGFGPHDWDANPWVVAISFSCEKGNIDQ
jgi:hypothetical protein